MTYNTDGGTEKHLSLGDNFILDNTTVSIEPYYLKQDGINTPNTPLRLKVVNRDGTTDYVSIYRKERNEHSAETTQSRAQEVNALIAKNLNSPQARFTLQQNSTDPLG